MPGDAFGVGLRLFLNHLNQNLLTWKLLTRYGFRWFSTSSFSSCHLVETMTTRTWFKQQLARLISTSAAQSAQASIGTARCRGFRDSGAYTATWLSYGFHWLLWIEQFNPSWNLGCLLDVVGPVLTVRTSIHFDILCCSMLFLYIDPFRCFWYSKFLFRVPVPRSARDAGTDAAEARTSIQSLPGRRGKPSEDEAGRHPGHQSGICETWQSCEGRSAWFLLGYFTMIWEIQSYADSYFVWVKLANTFTWHRKNP